MSWSPFWRLVELEYLDRGIPYRFDDLIQRDPRLEPHLIGAMAYWLWQYDAAAPSMSRSTGRLLWQDSVDADLSFKYTEMAAYMGAYATKYPDTIRPTREMLYRMGGHPRTEPAATAVEALAKLAAADIVDTESLVGELAMVLDWATPRRQLVGTHGLIALKLMADISLEPFADQFREILVTDPALRHVHSRATVPIGERLAKARKQHAVEALVLIEATESGSIVDGSQDVQSMVGEQDWGGLAAFAIATAAASEILPESFPDDIVIPVTVTEPHGVWNAIREAIIEFADDGPMEYQIAAVVLFSLLSGSDPSELDMRQLAAELDSIGCHSLRKQLSERTDTELE